MKTISVLVYQRASMAYAPYNKDWVKVTKARATLDYVVLEWYELGPLCIKFSVKFKFD